MGARATFTGDVGPGRLGLIPLLGGATWTAPVVVVAGRVSVVVDLVLASLGHEKTLFSVAFLGP